MKMQININVFIEIFEPFKWKLMRDHPKQQVITWSIRKFHKSLPGILTSLTWYDTVYMYRGIIAHFRSCCQRVNLRPSEFQCLISSLFRQKCNWANLKLEKTVFKCRRVKIPQVKTYPVYSIASVKSSYFHATHSHLIPLTNVTKRCIYHIVE